MYLIRPTYNGRLVINPKDRFLGRCLEQNAVFSPDEVALLGQCIDEHSIVVEAGANIGAITVPMAMTRARVYAFEPQRLLFQMLCANLVINGLPNVHAYQKGLGAVPGIITVPELDPETEQSFGSLDLRAQEEGESVEKTTIDAMNLPGCTLIKVDVEGMEFDVLDGAGDTIEECLPVLYVENDRLENSQALIAWILNRGYRAYWHTPVLAPGAANEFGQMVSVNMICIHSSRNAAVALNEITDPADRPSMETRRAA